MFKLSHSFAAVTTSIRHLQESRLLGIQVGLLPIPPWNPFKHYFCVNIVGSTTGTLLVLSASSSNLTISPGVNHQKRSHLSNYPMPAHLLSQRKHSTVVKTNHEPCRNKEELQRKTKSGCYHTKKIQQPNASHSCRTRMAKCILIATQQCFVFLPSVREERLHTCSLLVHLNHVRGLEEKEDD